MAEYSGSVMQWLSTVIQCSAVQLLGALTCWAFQVARMLQLNGGAALSEAAKNGNIKAVSTFAECHHAALHTTYHNIRHTTTLYHTYHNIRITPTHNT